MYGLHGKTALVTGAGRGIGKDLAIGLADAGANIAIVARNLVDACANEETVRL